jgi:allophanate hydrolase subunit 1
MDGWIVIGEVKGQVFDVKASGPTLLEMAKSSGLRDMERDYYEALDTGRH